MILTGVSADEVARDDGYIQCTYG